MAKEIPKEDAKEIAKKAVWKRYREKLGLEVTKTTKGKNNWVVRLSGGFPIRHSYIVEVNRKTGEPTFRK